MEHLPGRSVTSCLSREVRGHHKLHEYVRAQDARITRQPCDHTLTVM